MAREPQWAHVLDAAARSESLSADQRMAALKVALTLGSTITEMSVGSSITQATDEGCPTPAASSNLALELDLAQYSESDGPCVAACRDGRTHSVSIMADERAFPAFTAAAQRFGVGSSLSLPLPNRQAMALNLYAGSPHAFADEHAQDAASLLARCVGQFLPESVGPGVVDPDELRVALADRRTVEQARGIIAQRNGVGSAEAMAVLISRSRRSGTSLLDVATALCAEPDLASTSRGRPA